MSRSSAAVLPACAEKVCGRCGICSYSICGALAPDELLDLDKLARHVEYAPKETLFAQGEPASRVFNISEGVVRLYKLLPDGRRQVIGFKLQGDFLGLPAGTTHGLSADAVGHVSACAFNKTAFWRFVEDKLPMLRRMNDFANRELTLAQERMMLLGRYSAEEKIAAFLVNWRDRLARLDRRSSTIDLPMSRRDIADYLGLTIETVSRTFTKLEREKLVQVTPGGVVLLNPTRVERIAAALPADRG